MSTVSKRYDAFLLTLCVYLPLLLLAMRAGLLYADTVVTIGIFFMLVIGLDLLFGYTGQLSLGHQGFFAIGAYTVAIMARFFSLSPWLGMLVALVLNLLLAVSLGRILLRLSGVYFLLGTLAFGLIVQSVLTIWYPVTGGDSGIGSIPRLDLLGQPLTSNLSFGILVWILVFVLFWFALSLASSRLGRAMRAIRGDEVAAAANGVHVARVKINVFTLSVIYASISGSLFASYLGAVHPESFSLAALLEMLLMLFLGGQGTIWGPLLGTTLVRILPDASSVFANYRFMVNGLIFAGVLLALPDGFASGIRRLPLLRRSKTLAPVRVEELPLRHNGSLPTVASLTRQGIMLEVTGLSRHFGGIHAVDRVSFRVDRGHVKSIIGPNGAGKSTLLNLISGIDHPNSGHVRFGDQDITALRSDQTALLGIRRTFQNLRLFPELTAVENVMVGCFRRPQGHAIDMLRVGLPLPSVRREERRLYDHSRAWLAELGIEDLLDVAVKSLSYGQLKMVELARAVVAEPRLLLLDEPAAGLNDTEKQEFRRVIAGLRDRGTTVVLIEHDMDFVMGLSDEVLVMNFGCVIADGAPEHVQSDGAVVAAYLGV